MTLKSKTGNWNNEIKKYAKWRKKIQWEIWKLVDANVAARKMFRYKENIFDIM